LSEVKAPYETRANLLQNLCKPDKIDADTAETITVSRRELEEERRHLLGRLQQLHKLLGYPPIMTGKEQRRQAAE
jgi:hypothetical protein